jgi:hypothetical protein
MKICVFKSFQVVVLTRNEHCPSHVHVGASDWEARFQFSFLHNGVRLWDVIPAKNRPTAALLEGIRQVVMRSANLRRARESMVVNHNDCLSRQSALGCEGKRCRARW